MTRSSLVPSAAAQAAAARLALSAATIAATLLFPACQRGGGRSAQAPDSAAVARAESITVRTLVLAFGDRMKQVPLLGPESTLATTMRRQYGALATPTLIEEWTKNPRRAPGRLASSPWPDRIEIQTFARKSTLVFLIDGQIVERSSADSANPAPPIPVRLAVRKAGLRWLITEYDQGPPGAGGSGAGEDDPALTPERATGVIRSYYDALRARRYQEAYEMWEAAGTASGGSLIEFLNRNAQGRVEEVTIGTPGPMGAAAGSRYVDVPVHVVLLTRKGVRETYTGTYTLRRAVVDGATPRQRAWHIYSSNLKKAGSA